MTFTIKLPDTERPAPKTPALTGDRRLYLAADGHTLVEEGDARARWLLCATGHAIPGPDVERLCLALVDGRVVQMRADESKDQSSETRPAESQPEPVTDGEKARTPS